MKILRSITFLASFLFLISCGSRSVMGDSNYNEENTEETVETEVLEQRTITGKFRSTTAVMDELSCYCDNGGYVFAADGTKTALCFEEEVKSCDKITVTGYFTSKKIDKHGSCSEGIMRFLKVQSYIVGETEF